MSLPADAGLTRYNFTRAPSRAQPSIPVLTPPAKAGAKGTRVLGTPVTYALSGGALGA
jgi:hypothetical protein